MRRRFARHAVFILFLVTPAAFSQPVDFSETSFDVSVEWMIPHREFGEFWKPGPGAGLRAETPLAKSFLLTVGGRLSWFQRSESPRKDLIPHIVLVTLNVGLQSKTRLSPSLWLSGELSLANNTFIFTGPAAPDDFDNTVESEFGLQGLLRIHLGRIGLSVSYQHIFTGLDPVAVTSVGVFFILNP